MKTAFSIVIGLLIAIGAWVPLNMAGRYEIPFGEVILGVIGTTIGGVIVVLAVVRWARKGSERQSI